ncbi:MAG: hypothetical protein V1918_07215 [Planctomycetota bacterium]
MIEMRKKRRWKRIAVTAGVLAVAGPIVFYMICFLFFPRSKLCCTHYDVDIQTGRVRTTSYLFFMKIQEKIEDSYLTTLLTEEDLKDVQPEWKRVNTFSPDVRYSPHYVYHGAFGQIRELDMIFSGHGETFDPPTKRHIAKTVLRLWQESGNRFSAGHYIGKVFNLADQKERITIEELQKLEEAQP